MDLPDVANILTDARDLLAKRQYQTRFIAALATSENEVYRDVKGAYHERPRWVSVRADTKDAMLSLRGAITAVCGSGPVAWQVFAVMDDLGFDLWSEPPDKEAAIRLLDDCIKAIERRSTPRRVSA
jgi:hypothetical protein